MAPKKSRSGTSAPPLPEAVVAVLKEEKRAIDTLNRFLSLYKTGATQPGQLNAGTADALAAAASHLGLAMEYFKQGRPALAMWHAFLAGRRDAPADLIDDAKLGRIVRNTSGRSPKISPAAIAGLWSAHRASHPPVAGDLESVKAAVIEEAERRGWGLVSRQTVDRYRKKFNLI